MKWRWPSFEVDLPDLPDLDDVVKKALAESPDAEVTIKKTTVGTTTTIVTTITRKAKE